MKKLKLLDTFSGIGGFSYAAEKLVGGFETTQFIEIDPYCQKVLKKHWPNVPIHDDITTFTARPFQYDIISGGFPCQDISVAGRQKGITKTTRSGLFYELIRVIRMVRPKYIILENVSAILNNGLDIVLAELFEAGPYECEWATFPASLIGAAHQRDRWWLVAYPNSKQSSGTDSEIQAGRIFSSSSTKSKNVAYPNSDGHQGRCTETRNKVTTGQDSQIIGSTNTSELERCSDDGKDKGESRIDGNLSRSSDGGKTISTETGRICNLSQKSNNDQRTSRENKNQENNDRTLVSEGQSRLQLSEHRKLGRDQTTLENNPIRHGDDNNKNKGMDNKNSIATNTDSIRRRGGNSERRSIQERQLLQRKQEGSEMGGKTQRRSITTSNPNSIGTQSKDYKQNNASWKVPVGNGETRQTLSPKWRGYVSEPCLRRGDDGLRGRMDRLKSLGNSVVPQCAAIPLQRVKDLHEQLTSVDD